MFPKLLTISLIFATFPVAFSLNECVRAKGRVFCDGEAYQGAKVRLYDIDEVENLGPITKILKLLNPDDLMDRTISLADGSYELSGCARDFDWVAFNNQIEPFIFITHKCNGKSETVLVEVKVDRTDDYMTPEFDAGIMELSQAAKLE